MNSGAAHRLGAAKTLRTQPGQRGSPHPMPLAPTPLGALLGERFHRRGSRTQNTGATCHLDTGRGCSIPLVLTCPSNTHTYTLYSLRSTAPCPWPTEQAPSHSQAEEVSALPPLLPSKVCLASCKCHGNGRPNPGRHAKKHCNMRSASPPTKSVRGAPSSKHSQLSAFLPNP